MKILKGPSGFHLKGDFDFLGLASTSWVLTDHHWQARGRNETTYWKASIFPVQQAFIFL